jgi:aspartyl-tRNA(Asn)/glutamyl-tRNA(Gln) amidotransferase subunit B
MRDLPLDLWEPVIGLEIHAQLNTRSKMFSPAPNRFGDDPNTNISVVCTGMPGALPVLNKEAVKKAVQLGLALRSKFNLISRFDRKSYFYPDSPRNFQITQFETPILLGGEVEVDGKTFQIHHAHLEDDAGMLKHFNTFAAVDFNRAGAPLIEIVSAPCMHTPKEASAYAMAIRAILLYLDASDSNMDEGSLRIDANVSVRPKGEKGLRPKVEIKNINSFNYLELALQGEIERQIRIYTDSPHRLPSELIEPGTYRWDSERKTTILMRKKESAEDYRYFPEPDLVPIVLTQEYIDQVAALLPELPHDRFRRYTETLALTSYAASVLVNDKPLSDFFEETLQYSPHPRLLCNWITVEFAGRLKDTSLLLSGILPAHIGELVNLIEKGAITGKIAKAVADAMVERPGTSPSSIIAANPDFQPVSSVEALSPLIDQILDQNPQSITDYKAGREKAFAFLVGQVMKVTRGAADPALVNRLLKEKIERR